jgi:hypothetical protein
MISKELIEEYLFDIFGIEWKYSNDDYGYMFFEYNINIIGYNIEEGNWGKSLTRKLDKVFKSKLENGDIKVWNRKRKLENI